MASVAAELASFLGSSVFGNKLEVDPRDPVFYFSLPFLGRFAVMGIVYNVWFQMFALAGLHIVLNIISSLLAYFFILNKKQSPTALLVGYGIICPLLTAVPFSFIQAFDLRNPVLKLTAVSSPAIHVFRCLETIHGTLPDFAQTDLKSFLWYFGATVEFQVDPATKKTQPLTSQHIQRKVWNLLTMFVQCVALFTLLKPFDYNLFPRRQIRSVADIFFWGNLLNNYIMGAMTKTSIEIGMSLIGLVASFVSGSNTVDVNVRPLTMTSSPSDFWGKRWNTLVSNGLKRGVYKPCRKLGIPQPVAALATFAASGVLHEYLLAACAFGGGHNGADDYEYHLIGGHLLFFLWNAVVLILEGLLRGHPVLRLFDDVPKPIRTALVFITVLPICHLFTDQFVALGLYNGFGLGYPRVAPVNTTLFSSALDTSLLS